VTLLGTFNQNPRDVLGYLAAAAPTAGTFYRSNLPRIGLTDSAGDTGNVALTTQIMTSTPLMLAAGDLVTNLTFVSGATAAGTPTNWWFALYDTSATPALIAQTADQTTGAWAANTAKTVALSSAYTVPRTGAYWAAVMVKATTVPSLLGALVAPPILTGERKMAQTSGSSLVATAPATIATPTGVNFAPFCVAT
jgi:hypothetical protein